MLTKEILLAKRDVYERGRVKALGQFNAFIGAIEAIDDLLGILAQAEEAAARAATPVDVTEPGNIEESPADTPPTTPQEEGEPNA